MRGDQPVVSAASLIVRVSVSNARRPYHGRVNVRGDMGPRAPRASGTFAAVDIPAILGEAWSLYARFFVRFVAVAGVVFLVLGGLFSLIEHIAAGGEGTVVTSFLVFVAVNVGYVWIQGPLALVTAAARAGREAPSLGETLAGCGRPSGRCCPPAPWPRPASRSGRCWRSSPACTWRPAGRCSRPALVIEDLPARESFARSHALVKGHSWQIFGLLAVLLVLTIVASVVIVEVLRLLGADLVGGWLGSAIVNTIITPYAAIAITLVYFRLRAECDVEPAAR